MLLRENLKQTVRLLLLNVYASTESVLTALIHEIYDDCFFLFESLLSRFEQEELIEDENESELWIVFIVNHKRSSTVDRLEFKYCREVLHLSIKAFTLSADFKTALRKAYSVNYMMSHIMHFNTSAIQWCKKLTFYDFISKHRVTLVMNDFIEFLDNDNKEMTRLDHLFVHELNSARRLFANIFRVSRKMNKMNEILDVSFLHYTKSNNRKSDRSNTNRWNIIDLFAIQFKKLYILSMSKKMKTECLKLDEDENLLLVNWVLQYL